MSRELLILRHAKSDWDAGAASDFDRPLAKRGKKDAPRIGGWLYREGLVPELIISSPAERARQTTLKVCKALELGKKHVQWERDVYEAGLEDLLGVLARCPADAAVVLLVGHNPGMEMLLQHLAGDELDAPVEGKLLPTAALARLEMPKDWTQLKEGCATLLSLTRPKEI